MGDGVNYTVFLLAVIVHVKACHAVGAAFCVQHSRCSLWPHSRKSPLHCQINGVSAVRPLPRPEGEPVLDGSSHRLQTYSSAGGFTLQAAQGSGAGQETLLDMMTYVLQVSSGGWAHRHKARARSCCSRKVKTFAVGSGAQLQGPSRSPGCEVSVSHNTKPLPFSLPALL